MKAIDCNLTDDELQIVADAAENYPAGVTNEAWGYGPMAYPIRPSEYSSDTLEDFG